MNRRRFLGVSAASALAEHIEIPTGNLALAPSHAAHTKMYALEFGRTKARGELALSAAVQREQRILNATVSLEAGGPEEVAQSTFQWGTHPRLGVVDANCRVYGLGNLYVAGASVYPTGGAANPTLTLVAVSLRLSDHLKRTLA